MHSIAESSFEINSQMRCIFSILVACLSFKTAHCQSAVSGCFVGLEEMCWNEGKKKECYLDPSKPKEKWYHLTYIHIEGDSVLVNQYPIGIYKRDTVYSSSDGAFYFYRGKITVQGENLSFNLNMTHCDYCAIPADSAYREKWKHKTLTGQLSPQGIMINGYLFKPSDDTIRCLGQPVGWSTPHRLTLLSNYLPDSLSRL